MSTLIKEIMDALTAVNQNKTEPYDRQGEVKRIDGRTAWVKLEGSDRETPIQMTIACDVGDTVQARIGGGSAWLTGNLTAPPTDDKKANEAITMVTNVVQEIQEEVSEALEDVSTVDDVTMQYCLSDSSSTFIQYGDWSNTPPTYESGKYYWTRSVIYDDEGNPTYGTPRYSQDTQLTIETDIAFNSNNNHFWHDASGAYVSTADKSYQSGYATRITTSGILQSYNGNLLSSWTSSGINFYAGDGATAVASTTLASFGTSSVELGKNSTASSIYMCGGALKIDTTNDYHDSKYYLTTRIINDNSSSEKTLHLQSDKASLSLESSNYWGNGTFSVTTPTAFMSVYSTSSSGSGDIRLDSSSGGQIRCTSGSFTVTASSSASISGSNYDLSLGSETTLIAPTSIQLTSGSAYIKLYRNSQSTPICEVQGRLAVNTYAIQSRWAVSNTNTGTPNTNINSDGYIRVTTNTSSRRYKHDIKPVENEALNPHRLYDVEVVQFKYNEGMITDTEDCRYDKELIGFIAEQFAEHYPLAVDMNKDGDCETWNAQYVIPPMLALIQEQNERITKLEERLS